MKVLVCGGRDYNNVNIIYRTMYRLKERYGVTMLIEGGATGADRLAREWADMNGVQVLTFPAEWNIHGKSAGPIRNKKMLEEGRPDMVVAFPGGRGTQNMINQAHEFGVKVLLIGQLFEQGKEGGE